MVRRFFKNLILRITSCVMVLVTLFSAGGCSLADVFAWMSDNGLSSPIDITSNVHKTYFNGGEGSESNPYQIDNALQLYYFAWLQDLGLFNVDSDDEGTQIDTVYFVLTNNIDMSGYQLPPIGTTEHPFLGNFDGQGYTVSNLTVENEREHLFEPPEGSSEISKYTEIIGFFGVVGELNEGDYNYDTSANQVKNFVLADVTVNTHTDNALIGIVAGYVNAPIEFVGVVESKVNIANNNKQPSALEYTSNLSDYSLIGYCTNECKDSVYVFAASLANPGISDSYNVVPEAGGGTTTGWGGSVKMSDIVTWLNTVMGNRVSSTNNNYITERTDCVTLDGTTVTTGTVEDTIATYTVDGFGSFVGSHLNIYGGINYLGGAQKVTQYQYSLSSEDVDVYYIKDGNYYLCFDGNNIYSTQNQAEATTWYASNGTNGGTISTMIGDHIYYLTIASGTLRAIAEVNVNHSNLPSWNFSGNNCSLNGVSIKCENGNWRIVKNEMGSFKIASSNYYLDNNGTTAIQREQNVNNAAVWTITQVGDGYTVSTVINNTTYYLGYSSFTNYASLTLSENPTTWQWNRNNNQLNNNQLYIYNNGTPYYLRYRSSSRNWVFSTSSASFNLTEISGPVNDTPGETDIVSSNSKKQGFICEQKISVDNSLRNGYYDANGNKVEENRPAGITYFPLSTTVTMGTATNGSQDTYSIDSTNTGYIIGAEWGVNDGTLSEHDSGGANIRISTYDSGSMTNSNQPYTMSYKTGGKFKTISKTDSTTLSNLGLQKYADCYQDYISSIQNGCSGLHFMRASVSTSNMTRITATLRGETYQNYQVPTNCIDFNLYERGFINFVAGSYYTAEDPANNSFFSIYEVVRYPNDETSIKEIKEICKIYAQVTNGTIDTSKAYHYTYFDDKRNETGTAGIPEGYQMVFDSQWITHPNTDSYYGASDGPSAWANNKAFYFEVPVNAGEYAIGSTKDRTGAYLVYLDLAANAQLIDRTQQVEEITETLAGATIPNGVGMLAPSTEGYDTSTIDPSNSAFVSIGTNASGTIEFDKDGNVITQSGTTGTTAEYISVDTVLKDGAGNPMSVPITQTTKIVRTTYRDYNLTTGDYIVTVITTTTVTTNGQSKTTYTRQITTTPPEGEPVVGEVEEFDTLPTPATPDKADSPKPSVGEKLIDIAFAYGQEVKLTISYEYVPAGTDENGNATAPTYIITITNPGEEDVAIKAILTANGVSSGITFIITDGTTETILENSADAQKVVIAGTGSTEDPPAQPEEQPTE